MRIPRLQLQLPWYFVGINCCNALSFFTGLSFIRNIVCNNFVSNGTLHFLQKKHIGKNILLGAIRFFGEGPGKICQNTAVLPGKSYTAQTHDLWEHLQLGKKILAWDYGTNRTILPWAWDKHQVLFGKIAHVGPKAHVPNNICI